jgi:hypothetical protein
METYSIYERTITEDRKVVITPMKSNMTLEEAESFKNKLIEDELKELRVRLEFKYLIQK